ncbi:hypothetical protein D9M71_204640 [compost metagenome]
MRACSATAATASWAPKHRSCQAFEQVLKPNSTPPWRALSHRPCNAWSSMCPRLSRSGESICQRKYSALMPYTCARAGLSVRATGMGAVTGAIGAGRRNGLGAGNRHPASTGVALGRGVRRLSSNVRKAALGRVPAWMKCSLSCRASSRAPAMRFCRCCSRAYSANSACQSALRKNLSQSKNNSPICSKASTPLMLRVNSACSKACPAN